MWGTGDNIPTQAKGGLEWGTRLGLHAAKLDYNRLFHHLLDFSP